ncbi:MAG: radical SAM protein [Deltaproteobacteria bacterium]|nr:radical SAM protein [Deltaproteobacteria bacterium]
MNFTPFLISWNITKRCNLKCNHCYLDAVELEQGTGEMPTNGAKKIIDEIASVNPQAMLILTGGEPLRRNDCMELTQHASDKGLMVVMGTNGTLLNDSVVKEMLQCGVKGVGISLDSIKSSYHDKFRGLSGAWEKTTAGMGILKKHGLDFQVQVTVTKDNYSEIPDIINLAYEKGARAANIFFLVCTGRGQEMTDITPQQYEETLTYLVKAEKDYEGRIMVRARCAPHFLRIAHKINPESHLLKGSTSGCIAGTGYFRITPEGDVTPCPYIPTKIGNLSNTSLSHIWTTSPVFHSLRNPKYEGRCKECDYNEVCGGCRARAFAATSNIMGEDPWCEYEPKAKSKNPEVRSLSPQALSGGQKSEEIYWTPEAKERLSKVPVFLRGMVRKGLERYAKEKQLKEITPEIMAELRKRTGR